MPGLRFVAPEWRPVAHAISLSRALLRRSESDGLVRIAASIAQGPAVVLGSLERAGCSVNMEQAALRSVPVLRRATSGTAAYVGGKCLWWALALPHGAALFSDAQPHTLLNRNVRPFLRGLKQAGIAAQYFGREWIALRHSPALLLGFECTRGGAVLLEALLGVDEPVVLDRALKTQDEQTLDRLRGKTCVALRELSAISELALFEAVLAALSDQAGEEAQLDAAFEARERDEGMPVPIQHAFDPIPAYCNTLVNTKIPIGWLEAASGFLEDGSRAAWVGGDLLAPAWAIKEAAISGEIAEETAMLGATPEDIRKILNALWAQAI